MERDWKKKFAHKSLNTKRRKGRMDISMSIKFDSFLLDNDMTGKTNPESCKLREREKWIELKSIGYWRFQKESLRKKIRIP